MQYKSKKFGLNVGIFPGCVFVERVMYFKMSQTEATVSLYVSVCTECIQIL